MKKTTTSILCFACAILLLGPVLAFSQERHALPPNNPFLIQNSVYPSVHFDPAQTDTTSLPIWEGSSKIKPA
jgi:hypothetical protein